MDDWISFLPYIILAQALGVGLAWGIDAMSWKWRRSADTVFFLNFCGLLGASSLAVPPYFWFLSLQSVTVASAAVLSWLLIVAMVQKRQAKIPPSDAFFGVMMQFWCFALTLSGCLWLFDSFWQFSDALLVLLWFVSMIVTYALLSLFRPTIYGAWNAWRQNSGKNRPMR